MVHIYGRAEWDGWIISERGVERGALDVGLMAWFAVTRGAIEQQIGFLPCIVDADKNIGINRII